MMRVLDPTYTMRVTIKDKTRCGDNLSQAITAQGGEPPKLHKFFAPLQGKVGCDEAIAAVKDALAKAGIDAEVWLEQFSHS